MLTASCSQWRNFSKTFEGLTRPATVPIHLGSIQTCRHSGLFLLSFSLPPPKTLPIDATACSSAAADQIHAFRRPCTAYDYCYVRL